jgi:hypothetical protein
VTLQVLQCCQSFKAFINSQHVQINETFLRKLFFVVKKYNLILRFCIRRKTPIFTEYNGKMVTVTSPLSSSSSSSSPSSSSSLSKFVFFFYFSASCRHIIRCKMYRETFPTIPRMPPEVKYQSIAIGNSTESVFI